MSQSKIIAMEGMDCVNESMVGAKTMSLVRLVQIGLPVPPFFCISGNAYREHLSSNNLLDKIRGALKNISSASPEVKKDILSEIRLDIVKSPMSKTLQGEIEHHYRLLGTDTVAVRSSATAEDLPEHSFAGQHGTYFVSNLSSCILHTKHCWASLWTERAFEYRTRLDFNHLDIDMAVIVQKLIPSEVSGVLFTADPIAKRHDYLIIETCFGLGEALVSGKVTPDKIVLAKDGLRVIEHTVNQKDLEIALNKDGIVQEKTIPHTRAKLQCLDEATAQLLGKLALKAEVTFGSPQDLEWAYFDKELFFIQSRPITALRKEKSFEDRQVWSNVNTGEVLPDVVTPMSWSIINPLVKSMFDSIFDPIGIDFSGNPLIGWIAGRAYFNLNVVAGATRKSPLMRKVDFNDILGGAQGEMIDLGQLEFPEEDIPDLKFSPLKMAIKLPSLALWLILHPPKRGIKLVAKLNQRTEKIRELDLSSLSEDSLVKHLKSSVDELLRKLHYIGFVMVGMVHFVNLNRICQKWLGDTNGNYVNRLLSGMGNMDSAEAGLRLWQLATEAHRYPEVESLILSGKNYDVIRKNLAWAEGGAGFLTEWDGFIAKHGHHTRGELELANARWSETPDYVINMVKSYLQNIDNMNPVAQYNNRAKERDQLIKQCQRSLRNPIKRKIFNFSLKQAQSGAIVRENLKSTAVRYLAIIRSALLKLEQRLVRSSFLENRDDIFFLQLEEIESMQKGKADFDIKETIASRRAEYERNRAITPPKVIIGKFDPDNFVPDEVDESAKILKGLSVSPGVVSGPARVILRSDSQERVHPGEILVAPFTDPGWTPYFMPAAAIVMDMGGLLSHGSIVAREYGIPAVVNVGPATKIIKTGQTIQVDGNNGVIKILR